MINWNYWLGRKYANMEQETANRGAGLQAQAKLDTVKAGLLPAESAASIGLTQANTGLARAETARTNETTKTIAPLASASIFETRSRGRLLGEQATGEGQLNKVNTNLFRFRGLGSSLGTIDSLVRNSLRFGMGPFAGSDEDD